MRLCHFGFLFVENADQFITTLMKIFDTHKQIAMSNSSRTLDETFCGNLIYPLFSDLQNLSDMVVPTDHELHEAIQVAPLILSDDVRRQKVSTTLAKSVLYIISHAQTFYLRRIILYIVHPELLLFHTRCVRQSWMLTLHRNLARQKHIEYSQLYVCGIFNFNFCRRIRELWNYLRIFFLNPEYFQM